MEYFDNTFLKELININSQSLDVEGVNRAQNLLARELSQLGMEVEWFKNPETTSGDALKASIGKGKYTVTLLGHSDTVARGGEAFSFERHSDGRLTGAGIGDMKGGLSVIVEALRYYLPVMNPELTINVIVSPNEEVGSPGFHEFFRKEGEKSDLVLCFEPALPDGSFIRGRNGNRWYDMTFSGEKFHTGRAPKGSANVLHQICELENYLQKKISDSTYTKFNITSISCDNDKYNVSAGEASLKMDLRFATVDAREDFHHHLLSWVEEKNIPFKYSIPDDCPPLANVNEEKLVELFKMKLNLSHSRTVDCLHCEGASDANYFSTKQNVVLDGLGPLGDYFHSRKEFILEETLFQRASGLLEFLKALPQDQLKITKEDSLILD